MQELWFLQSACPLILVDICMKFNDASLYGLRLKSGHDGVWDKVPWEITQNI